MNIYLFVCWLSVPQSLGKHQLALTWRLASAKGNNGSNEDIYRTTVCSKYPNHTLLRLTSLMYGNKRAVLQILCWFWRQIPLPRWQNNLLQMSSKSKHQSLCGSLMFYSILVRQLLQWHKCVGNSRYTWKIWLGLCRDSAADPEDFKRLTDAVKNKMITSASWR